ncbi:MAG: hypothetical protein Q3978_03950 [Limosilactobacillus gorillae]|jgi:hypothetical protein|uniref:hypothetical protein n=1 Tax=Limosilactobacillus gorillae TaxID=1450649 RepID=UPI000A52897C|nr:hypothetical protein [Limosilactobacillus gorillae]MDO4855700.1 hypothetical protein [Limosilactobacillus gorillae]
MWDQLKAQVKATDWQDLLPTICIQLLTWSYAPFAYVVGVDGTHFTSHFGTLFLYELCIGAAITLTINHRFKAPLSLIPLTLSIILAVVGFFKSPILLTLLILLSAYLAILPLPNVDLRGGLGLITLGILLTLTIPVACAFTSTHFMSWIIVRYFVPLTCSVWFFYGPFFISNAKHLVPFQSVTGLLMAATILSRPLSLMTVLALLITVGVWFMVILPTTRNRYWNFVYANLAQLITIVLIYWT